jgi:hypothetical protein
MNSIIKCQICGMEFLTRGGYKQHLSWRKHLIAREKKDEEIKETIIGYTTYYSVDGHTNLEVSNLCVEICPCVHTVKGYGEMNGQDIFYLFQMKGIEPPNHFQIYQNPG